MANVTHKAVLRLKYKTDTVGIINIRESINQKHTFHSLKIKIPVRFWNKKSGTVRKNDTIDYQSINTDIETKLKEFAAYQKQPDYVPIPTKLSFLNYFKRFIKRYDNVGSRIKYESVLKKLEAFLATIDKKDLLFHEINSVLLYDYRNFILKKATTNTATHYLKLFKQVLNGAIAENQYNYIRHPFISVDFKNTKIKRSALSEDEIKKLIQANIPEDEPLHDVRSKFLTQMLLQGMRVSDLQLLRYSMINGDNVDYTMFKTNNFMSVYISDAVWNIFIFQFKKHLLKHDIKLEAISSIEKQLDDAKQRAIVYLQSIGFQSGFDIIIRDRSQKTEINEMMPNKEIFENIRNIQTQILLSYQTVITHYGKDNPDAFIFDFLQDVDFSNIKNNDFSKVTEKQYKIIKHKSIVYNRQLKDLQKLAKIETTFKSHLSRSSYASLLLNSDVDVYNISAALGHSGLNITEKYLSGFNRSKTDTINKQISDKLFTK